MSDRKLIGRVSATEKYPSSCDDFQFWLSDDAILSPFDIVRVENKTDDSITYGVVQDILHITDGTGHLSNYVSSDFGNVDTTPMTRRLSLSYAKVSVIHNTKENFMPVFEGSPVYTADNRDIEIALGLDNIDEKTAIPAGLMKASNNIAVPIKYNGDFLIGPEGAHMNISGISGLATKTSYVMFLLKAIQHKYKDDVAIIVMNVKGDVAAGSSFFYKAFGNNLEEYHELLAMPRELIMFRSHFEENGTTAKWQTLYRQLNDEQKDRLMKLVSLNVSELKNTPWPSDLAEILDFYLLKYSGKTERNQEKYVQMSLMDDSDVVVED